MAGLSGKSAAVIGLGALGSVTAELLAKSVGTIVLIDHDIVEQSNLERQPFYDKGNVNKLKCEVVHEKLMKRYSKIIIVSRAVHIDQQTIKEVNADIILDCTDNFETRFVINDYCKKNNIPWVHAAATGSIGVVVPFTGNYCFGCIYGNKKKGLTCDDSGIMIEVARKTAQIQVDEALKILNGEGCTQGMIRFVGGVIDTFAIKDGCNCMGRKENNVQFTLSKCTTRAGYSAKPSKNMKLNLSRIKEKFTTLIETPIVLVIKENDIEIVVHEYGELLFKSGTDEELMNKIAKKVYSFKL